VHPEVGGGPEDVVWAQPWERGRPRPPLHAPALRDRSDLRNTSDPADNLGMHASAGAVVPNGSPAWVARVQGARSRLEPWRDGEQRRAMGAIRDRMSWVLAGLVALLFIGVLGTGVAAGWWVARSIATPGPARIADTASVVTRVQGLHQLVSVKYVVEKVVLLEDAKWYGESRLLMVAHGVAKAGVDLSRLDARAVRADGRRVRVELPRPQLTDVYLDDRRTQVVERSTGVLRAFDKDLEQDGRRQALDQVRLAVREAGILKDAEDRARQQVSALFRQSGFDQVEVTFR